MGEAVGVEDEGEFSSHRFEGLIVGGSEASITRVGDEYYFWVIKSYVVLSAIFASVVDDDDFVDRLVFEGG